MFADMTGWEELTEKPLRPIFSFPEKKEITALFMRNAITVIPEPFTSAEKSTDCPNRLQLPRRLHF